MDLAVLLTPAMLGSTATVGACVLAGVVALDGYRRGRHAPTLAYLEDDIARRASERDAVQREINTLREELSVLNDERTELGLIQAKRQDEEARLEDLLGRLEGLEEDRRRLDAMRADLARAQEDKDAIERKLAEARDEERSGRRAIDELAARQEAIKRTIAEAEARREAITSELERLTAERDQRAGEIAELTLQRDQRSREIARLTEEREQRSRETEQAKAERDAAKADAENARRLRDETLAEAETQAERLSALQNEIRTAEQQAAAGREMQTRLAEEIAKLENDRNSLKHEAAALAALRAEMTELYYQRDLLQAKIKELQGVHSPESEEHMQAVLGELLTPPTPLRAATRRSSFPDEEKALRQVRDQLEMQGLQFPERLVNAFHTSLKISSISPMTVLAGISGTGKSELPRQYAAALGLPFFQLAVQPRWDSPQDLFGFYNYLEHRYKPTELARLMVHLDDRNWKKYAEGYREHMALVLLDEMNLARVEYYFSEFLSRLEVRRDQDGVEAANIELELGRLPENQAKTVYPVRRLLFVGTMNEDESTQTLSDKVVDRANVMRFPKPKTLSADRPKSMESLESNRFLPFSTWESWIRKDHPSGQLGEWLETINGHLASLGRPFGHRMSQAITAYVINHPKSRQSIADAFADQLEMRIFPKLRGVSPDEGDNRVAFDALGKFIVENLGDEKLKSAFDDAVKQDFFLWRGVDRA